MISTIKDLKEKVEDLEEKGLGGDTEIIVSLVIDSESFVIDGASIEISENENSEEIKKVSLKITLPPEFTEFEHDEDKNGN